MEYILRIIDRDGTLAEGEIVHRIKEIGLSHAVTANEAVDLGRERDIHLTQVPVI